MTEDELQQDFDQFFEDFFIGLSAYGDLVEMHV